MCVYAYIHANVRCCKQEGNTYKGIYETRTNSDKMHIDPTYNKIQLKAAIANAESTYCYKDAAVNIHKQQTNVCTYIHTHMCVCIYVYIHILAAI